MIAAPQCFGTTKAINNLIGNDTVTICKMKSYFSFNAEVAVVEQAQLWA